MSVVCSVEAVKSHGEVTITITGPATDNGNHVVNRTQVDTQVRPRDSTGSTQIFTTTLSVTNLSEEDSGEYKCSAVGATGAKSSIVSRSIKVVRSDEVFIGKFLFEHGRHRINQPPGMLQTQLFCQYYSIFRCQGN